jgi:hypothetical protein
MCVGAIVTAVAIARVEAVRRPTSYIGLGLP